VIEKAVLFVVNRINGLINAEIRCLGESKALERRVLLLIEEEILIT
jgi:hypothetical protein